MIVGFATRGQGRGSGPVGYCVQETVTQAKKGTHTRTPPPTVLRGDPVATERLIDSLSFKYKYKSGVLSFAPGETITPEMERSIMDRFEAVAFAGLEHDQFDILWVRHEHAGHAELHFVTPRVELTTGKSLNICPPGRGARQAYDDFRSMINAEYGLADPDDPARERDIQHAPGDRRAVAWEALGLSDVVSAAKRRIELRDLAHSMIAGRVESGLIRDRASLLEQVQELGFSVTRSSNSSITLLHPDDPDQTRFKMKGQLYGAGWQFEQTAQRANEVGERDYSNRDPAAARRYAGRVEQHIQRRADYSRARYARPEPEAGDALPALDSVTEPAAGGDLDSYIGRCLGVDAVSVAADQRPARDASEPDNAGRGAGEAVGWPRVLDTAGGREAERAEADQGRPDLRSVEEVRHDGIGTDIAASIAAIRDASVRSAAGARRAAAGARQYVGRAGACLQRIRNAGSAGVGLEAAIGRFERRLMAAEGKAARAASYKPQELERKPKPQEPSRGGWEPPSM